MHDIDLADEEKLKKYIEDNKKLYESKFFANNFDISKNVDEKTFQKINNFIETGILINE